MTFYSQTDFPNCNVGDVRLVGGNTALEGRGEICIDGMWGSICDNMWSQNDANVLCGQLGYAAFGETFITISDNISLSLSLSLSLSSSSSQTHHQL